MTSIRCHNQTKSTMYNLSTLFGFMEMEGRDLEGYNFLCLDNNIGERDLEGKDLKGLVSLILLMTKSLQKRRVLEGNGLFLRLPSFPS